MTSFGICSFIKGGECFPRLEADETVVPTCKCRNYMWPLPLSPKQSPSHQICQSSVPGPGNQNWVGRDRFREMFKMWKQEYPGWWFRVSFEAGLDLPLWWLLIALSQEFLLILLLCLKVNGFEIRLGYWVASFKNIETAQMILKLITIESRPTHWDIFIFDHLAELGERGWIEGWVGRLGVKVLGHH